MLRAVPCEEAGAEFCERIDGHFRRFEGHRHAVAGHGRNHRQGIADAALRAGDRALKVQAKPGHHAQGALIKSNAVCTVLSYARERGCLPREKKTEAELLKRFKETAEEVGIYTPKEIRRVLGAAAGPVRAAIAIGAFAGLRNEEIHRLQWGDINLEAGRIIVSADKAKTAQRRIVPILPNLRAWLEPLKQADGPVGPKVEHLTNFSRNISVACKAAGVEMVGNGLRHSFASYRLASVKSADQVALEMGNSPRKLFQHYRELVTAEAAAAWFNVTLETLEETDEDTPENVVSITRAQAV